METTSRRIEYTPIDDILGTDRNPRSHDLPAVIRSIAVLGFTAPAVADERTNRLIIGNGRLEALRIIRDFVDGNPVPPEYDGLFKEARVTRSLTADDGTRHAPDGITVEDGVWSVPLVRGWESRDDDHAHAAVVADNKLTELGGWDEQILAEWLDEILDTDPDLLSVTGYTADDLDDFMANLGRVEVMAPQPTGARYAETDEQVEERREHIGAYRDRTDGGAVTEMILVFPSSEHAEAVALIRAIRTRDGEQTAAQVVLGALRAHAPETE